MVRPVEGGPPRAPRRPSRRRSRRCRCCGPSWPADELVGLDRLRAFADELYGDRDPAAVLHDSEPLRIKKKDDGYVLTQELPFADRDDLEVGRRGDELLVRIGPYRRAILLPDSLRRRGGHRRPAPQGEAAGNLRPRDQEARPVSEPSRRTTSPIADERRRRASSTSRPRPTR